MKILQVCSARNGTYGAVVSLEFLAKELRNTGHEVVFATFKGRGFGEYVRGLGFEDRQFRVRAKIDPFAAMKLASYARREGFDLLHGHLSTSCVLAGVAGRFAKLPTVASVHGMSRKQSYTFCRHMIAVSGEVKKHLVGQGVDAARISVVHNGIPIGPLASSVEKLELRKTLGLPADALLAGTVARLTPLKGVDQAIRAVAKLAESFPSLVYLLFGDGQARQDLEALAKELGIETHVKFMGYRPDARDLLPALDLFLFPSLKEAMGIAVVEGMAAGIPVVAYTVGGVPEVLEGGAGTLVPMGDYESMAVEAARYLSSDVLRSEIGLKGYERAKAEFSVEGMCSKTVDVYRRQIEATGA